MNLLKVAYKRKLSLIPRSFLLLFVALTIASCGGGSSSTSTPPSNPTVTSVTVSCSSLSIQTNQTSTCTATVTGTGSPSQAVTWSVSPSSIGSVSSSGVFTPTGAGTATITATSTQDSTKSGTATIAVTAASTVTSVAVVCAPASIQTNQTSACMATVSGTGSYSSVIMWSVSPASIGAISSTGIFTPATAGTATITATSTQDSTKSGSTTVTVAVPVTITGVSVTCAPTSILTTQTSTCTPTVSGTGSYSSAVAWTVTPGSIGAVSSTGVFTPATAGTATITATSTRDSTKSGSTTVTVAVPSTITAVSVVCSPASILTSQTSTCTPTISGTGSYSSAVTWSVSPSPVGAVSSTGVFTPAAAGTATITATSTQDSTKSGATSVTVTAPAPLQHGALLTSPTLYASATATVVTLSIWLPDADLNTTSVTAYETDQNGLGISTKGLLNDAGVNGDVSAGDKVYTLQFNVNDSSPTTHYYAVSYQSISTGATYSTETNSTTSVPVVTVSDESSYSLNIQDSLTQLINGTTTYQAIFPTSATSIDQKALDSFTATIVSVLGNIQQLSSYDSTNPMAAHVHMVGMNSGIHPMGGGFSFWSLVPFGLGDVAKKQNELAKEKKAFISPSFSPNDPAVSEVMAWLAKNQGWESACDPDIIHDNSDSCRPYIFEQYSLSSDAGLRQAATTSGTSFGMSEYYSIGEDAASGIAEDATGELLSSQTDLSPLVQWSITKSAGIGTDYLIDNFTALSGRQMLLLGSVSQGQSTMLPNGSHNIILASSSSRTETPEIASQAIGTLSPASLVVGAAPQSLTINGTGFLPSSTVTFNGVSHTATYISATQLTIPLTSVDLATVGTYPVVVTNPAPDGIVSSTASFTVTSTQAKNEFLYVAYNDLQPGDVAGFSIDSSSGQLQSFGSVFQSGDYVYSLAGDPQGQYLSLATYFSQGGGIAINNLPINATDGTLSTAAAQGSIGACCSPHYIAFDPSGYYLYDTVKVNGPGLVGTFSLDRSSGAVTAIDASSGGGGGGIAASPTGGYFATSDTGTWDHGPLLETYELTADGHLVSAYPQSAAAGVAPAGVAIDPTGWFAYTANTGDGTISGYSVSLGAALTPISGSPFAFGTTPRSIAISPSGTFLFVSDDTGLVGVFKRDTSSGALTLQSTTHLPGWPTVGVVYSYLALDSTGQYLYIIATGNPPIYAYAINPSTGALTSLQGSPYSVASETKAAALAVVQEK